MNDSFDARVCDDLSEVSYNIFVTRRQTQTRRRLKSSSQRTLFETQYRLEIDEHFIPGYDPTEYKVTIGCQLLLSVLKKCHKINDIIIFSSYVLQTFEEFENLSEVLSTIAECCHSLKSLHLNYKTFRD